MSQMTMDTSSETVTGGKAMPDAPTPSAADPRVFEALIVEHQDVAYSVAYRFVGSREAAEDVVQEAVLRAYRARDRFVGGNFRAWLLRIVSNVALDELRRRKRRPQRSLDMMHEQAPEPRAFEPPDPAPLPDERAAQHELRATLERALGGLPDPWRMVVVLSDVHGLSYPEIAEVTGVPVGTVKSRLSRARAELRKVLRPDGEPHVSAAGRVCAAPRTRERPSLTVQTTC